MDFKGCIEEKVKKIFIYFFLLIFVSSISNLKLSNFKFEKIKNINVSGLKDTENLDLVYKIKGLNIGNIFFLNQEQLINLINSYNSIESFIIKKKYPSTIYIEITKTNFLAKINDNGKIFLIGSNGKLSNEDFSNKHLPFIFGKLDVKEFLNFKKIIDHSKFSFQEIENLYFFPSKRWDLELKNNIILKLSKDNPKLSLNNAFEVLNDKNFSNIKIVDARINNQIILND